MKKILILNHNHERFGTYFRCYFIAEGLSKFGYKVTMVCASGKNFDLLIKKQKISDNFEIITLPRIKYHKYFSGQVILRLPLTILLVLFCRYDLLYSFAVALPQIGIPAWVGKKIRGKKLIIDWDDLWGGGFAVTHGEIVEKVLTWCERNFIKVADKVTYVSDYLGKEIERIDPEIVKVKIENGANSEQIKVLDKIDARKKLSFSRDDILAVSIGNTYTASFGLMLQAFLEAKKEIKKLRLILVGKVVVKDEFKKIFESLGKSVTIIGSKPYFEMPCYMAIADVLLLPMDDDPIEWARFPMRLGDYLCAGRPIVSNAVGEAKYYLEKYNAGLTSPPASTKEFGDNILRVLRDKKLADKLSQNARKLAEENLSRDNVVQKLNGTINSLLSV